MSEPEFAVGDAIRVAPGVARHATAPGFVVMVDRTAGPLDEPAPDSLPLGDRDSLPRQPEYGVIFGIHRPPWRPDKPGQLQYDSDAVRWFAPHELVRRSG